jgi:hypothetical protein
LFDQAVAKLRKLSEEILGASSAAASVVPTPTVRGWTDRIGAVIEDLLETQRRAPYADMTAIGAALADAIVERPPAAPSPAPAADAVDRIDLPPLSAYTAAGCSR